MKYIYVVKSQKMGVRYRYVKAYSNPLPDKTRVCGRDDDWRMSLGRSS